MATAGERRRDRLRTLSRRLVRAQRPIRILKALAWPDEVRERFLAARGRELPRPVHAPLGFDPRGTIEEFEGLLADLRPRDPVERLLGEAARSYVGCVRMLARRGTREFHRRSVELYGSPDHPFDERMSELELALRFDRALKGFAAEELAPEPPRTVSAARAAVLLRRRLERAFGAGRAPRVRLASLLTADAAAGAATIRLKRGRMFSLNALAQLEQHEGQVHAATTLNGRAQPVLPCLGKGAPRTAGCQEGLAVFAELVARALDVRRLKTLVDRVIAVRMAADGADFIELWRFFQEEGNDEVRAYDNARRVVRGGVVTGGAPFTKDVVYLDGLVRVYTWARVAMRAGRPELLRFLWVGKVAIEDLPVLWESHLEGLIEAPRFLPEWARDVHHLAAYMCFSALVDQLDSAAIERRWEALLRAVPD